MSVAAFFDLDGTLLPPPSLERRFVCHLLSRGTLGVGQIARWLLEACEAAVRFPRAAFAVNKGYLAGVACVTADSFAEQFLHRAIPLFPRALAQLEWHAAQGHPIFLVSGTLMPLAEALRDRLPISADVCATRLDVSGGTWTGRTIGEAARGPGKARVVQHLAKIHGLHLGRCFAYGNGFSDRWMLANVGRPVAVNPSAGLHWLARRNHWPVVHWRCASDRAALGTRAALSRPRFPWDWPSLEE